MTSVIAAGAIWGGPRLSPDGTHVAVVKSGETGGQDIWIRDLERGGETKLTAGGSDRWPIWTPDGSKITFDSTRRGGTLDLYWRPADFSGEAELLLEAPEHLVPQSWSPDGQTLVYTKRSGQTRIDIWSLVDGVSSPVVVREANDFAPLLAPDGQWLAYVSDQTGENRVYLQGFPEGGRVIPVSTGGGTEPVWSRDGRELFYRNGNQMVVVAVETEPEFNVGTPRVLFEGTYEHEPVGAGNPNYDVSLDGQRFLMIRRSDTGETSALTFVGNWFEELKRLVPLN